VAASRTACFTLSSERDSKQVVVGFFAIGRTAIAARNMSSFAHFFYIPSGVTQHLFLSRGIRGSPSSPSPYNNNNNNNNNNNSLCYTRRLFQKLRRTRAVSLRHLYLCLSRLIPTTQRCRQQSDQQQAHGTASAHSIPLLCSNHRHRAAAKLRAPANRRSGRARRRQELCADAGKPETCRPIIRIDLDPTRRRRP